MHGAVTTGVEPAPPTPRAHAVPLLRLQGISKSYGPTRANENLTFDIAAGEIAGLIGANGAGKSTLMRILAGITLPDSGDVVVAGTVLDLPRFSPQQARAAGIRIVHQELSLCDSLTVTENFYIEQPELAGRLPAWRRHYEALARRSIAAIFPENGIDVRARVADLTIAQRQMVEIARAASDPKLRVLILDEPTSSLDEQHSADLQRFIGKCAASGVAVIFISHKLREVAAIATRILVMRNGRLVRDAPASAISIPQMVEAMAGEAARDLESRHAAAGGAATGATVVGIASGRWSAEPVALCCGEIVGLGGLEGSGQREFLHALHDAARGRRMAGITCGRRAAYVSGDRRGEGVFPLWNVVSNALIGRIASAPGLRFLSSRESRDIVSPWLDAVRLPRERHGSPILELSGGNQQKVLMARALIADADIILLDDPTRGVDVSVKRDFYRLIREAAGRGKLVVWYSSETIEFLECDRVLLFHDGAIRRALAGDTLSEDAIVGASFAEQVAGGGPLRAHVHDSVARREALLRLVPFLTTALMFAVIALLNHNAATLFGIDLLLSAAVPVVLVALAQMFVVGGSEIDLGVGAFAGLVNVLSATILVDATWSGFGLLAASVLAYAVLGLLIQARAIPAIVVTLGASFIWAGIGYALQPTPGGSAPAWLASVTAVHLAGLPASLLAILLAGAAAAWLNASRLGVMLRGFGANPRALEQGGWSPFRASVLRYAVAGTFALLAGLAMTAINTASDINAGSAYTLLSVAAVVVGGSALAGGRIAPVGVVCGALSLSLIGSLLGFLGVSTDYNAAVQGGLLIGILFLREMLARGRA